MTTNRDNYSENYVIKNTQRAKRRKNSVKKALRKQKLTKEIYWSAEDNDCKYYDNLHQYSKNKIHCSCPICAEKTNTKKLAKGKGHGPRNSLNHYGTTNERHGKNWSISDYKKILNLTEQLKEV